jgi:hypothetical protein
MSAPLYREMPLSHRDRMTEPVVVAGLHVTPRHFPRSTAKALASAAEHRRLAKDAMRRGDRAFYDYYVSWAKKQLALAHWFSTGEEDARF